MCIFLNDGPSVWGHTEIYSVKWLPTVKIEYRIRNYCDHDYWAERHHCGALYMELINWCEWTWESHKGGFWDIDNCIRYEFDVNGR